MSFAFCQQTDSTVLEDSVSVAVQGDSSNFDSYEEEAFVDYDAPADSSFIEKRGFDESHIEKLKDDSDLDYRVPPSVGESLWDRFLRWLGQLIDGFFDGAVRTNWGRVITYIVGLALLIVLIMLMLKVNAFKVIYSAEGSSKKYQVLDENIHEMDFDRLIQDAVTTQDYRRGIRLLFLYALKLLSDKQLIHWQSGKTNHDYVSELGPNTLKTGLNELSFYFDYAWYGNFYINHDTFVKVQETFKDWKRKLD